MSKDMNTDERVRIRVFGEIDCLIGRSKFKDKTQKGGGGSRFSV